MVVDFPYLPVIVIVRNYNVPWVTHDVDYPWKCRIEAVMTLDDARPGHPLKIFSWSG